jgi:hypothetical protein
MLQFLNAPTIQPSHSLDLGFDVVSEPSDKMLQRIRSHVIIPDLVDYCNCITEALHVDMESRPLKTR